MFSLGLPIFSVLNSLREKEIWLSHEKWVKFEESLNAYFCLSKSLILANLVRILWFQKFSFNNPRLHKIHLFYDGQFLNFLIYFALEEFLANKVLVDLFAIPDKISHSESECTFNVKTLLVHDNDIMIDNSIVGSPTNKLIVELEEREGLFSFLSFYCNLLIIKEDT